MKMIRYKVLSHMLVYNPETEAVEQQECFAEFIRDYSEVNEEIAKREAHNGDYEICDIEGSEAEAQTPEQRIAELEEALNLLLSGVTE